MNYFKYFSSNSLAGSGNQSFFFSENPKNISTSRVFYKVFKGGYYNYSILFSNIIDSTYSTGEFSHKNIICDEWYIDSLRIGICDECNCDTMTQISNFIDLTFDGNVTKTVMPGEFFYTDAIPLDIQPNQYICLEMAFHGAMLPCHPESLIPSFLLKDGIWEPSKNMPVPSMIGCDRNVTQKIAYLGDSITQGIGTAPNSYTSWNCVLSHNLGANNAYWNLGLGFGRADDAASNGAWLFKAKQADVVFVCYGVNDILQGFSEESIKKNLVIIADKLKRENILVVFQTVPPFDYDEPHRVIWENVNSFIKTTMAEHFPVFDNVPVLSDPQKGSHFAKYGGHPSEDGCAAWGECLYTYVNHFLSKTK